VAGLEARKAQDLLAYLLIYRDRPHAREVLAELFWGERSSSQSKKYLRQALWQVQSALDEGIADSGPPLLLVDGEWVRMNEDADYWLDVALFEQAYGLVRGTSGREMNGQCAEALRAAVELYRGDLLEGCYQDWCLYERERLQNTYLSMLGKLIACCEAHGQFDDGLAFGERILRQDRAHERAHRCMMRLHYLAGNRTEALRQYERCVEALREELGVKPARRTVALYERLRADRLEDPAQVSDQGATNLEASTLPELLARLKRLQVALAGVQGEIQQNIDAVQAALNLRR
jgi:DNA-binding SARP family transcriptional activator